MNVLNGFLASLYSIISIATVSIGIVLAVAACQPRDVKPSESDKLVDAYLSDEQVTKKLVISPSGIGPIKIGMTIDEAEVVSGMDLAVYGDSKPTACEYVKPLDEFPELSFVVVEAKIVRMALNRWVSRIVSDTVPPTIERVRVDSILSTQRGIGLGSSQAEVEAAYPNAEISPHQYVPSGYYLTITSSDDGYSSESKLMFETDGVEVTRINAGRLPETNFLEGCS